MSEKIELYPYEPARLLPLLALHLPYSLAVYSSILETIAFASPTPNLGDPHGRPWDYVWSTIRTDQLDLYLSEAYPDTESQVEEIFVVITQLAGSMKEQTRTYCSAERPSTIRSVQVDADQDGYFKRAKDMVQRSVERYLAMSDTVLKFGGVNELWSAGICEMFGLAVPGGQYDIWIEPLSSSRSESSRKTDKMEERRLPEEYIVDTGHKEDCQIVRQLNQCEKGFKADCSGATKRSAIREKSRLI